MWLTENVSSIRRTYAAPAYSPSRIRSAEGDALSAFGRKTVLNGIEGRSHLPRSQESGLGAEKRLEGTVRDDTMLVNETEWPGVVAGRMSYGKCRSMRGTTFRGRILGVGVVRFKRNLRPHF